MIARGFDTSAIVDAYDLLPPRLRERLDGIEFHAGAPGWFLGLWERDVTYSNGRLVYRPDECAIALHDGSIYLPPGFHTWDSHHYRVGAVLHELGHQLDNRLGNVHDLPAVTEYATHNRCEAFAEAFSNWLLPRTPDIHRRLRQTYAPALFAQLTDLMHVDARPAITPSYAHPLPL